MPFIFKIKDTECLKTTFKQYRKIKQKPMIGISYSQAELYVKLAALLRVNNPPKPIYRYSLPSLEDYEIALQKHLLTDGAEYLANGQIVIIDTQKKMLQVVSSTDTDEKIRFRLKLTKINA